MIMRQLYLRHFLFFTFSILLISFVTAQEIGSFRRNPEKEAKRKARREKIENYIRQQEEGALVFNKQTAWGFRLNTDGWNGFVEKGIMKTVKTTNIYYLEVGEKKNPKEKKVSNTIPDGNFVQAGNPCIFGKRNIFYQIKPGFGQQRLIGAKANKNGISVHWTYSGGVSLGLLRPYYVRAFFIDGNNQIADQLIKFNEKNVDTFNITNGYLLEGTGLKYGWNEMKIVPGLHSKTSLRFDYGRFNEMVSAIEVGLNVEYYFNDIEVLARNQPQKFFFNAFVAILLGRRK